MAQKKCHHAYLHLEPSPFAELAGYQQPDAAKRGLAENKTARTFDTPIRPLTMFPAPLVLPHDDLNYDPDQEAQSFKSWYTEKARNKMTDERRNTIYIARIPDIKNEVESMRRWRIPKPYKPMLSNPPSPDVQHFADYLAAFYHGVSVKTFPNQLSWTIWGKSKKSLSINELPKFIGLSDNSSGSTTRIRVRASPDGTFPAQLNLDDILDTAISILPKDAYALCLLVDHDIYENDDDDFCCGRAYGGSRVAVVQTARYNPFLDELEKIDLEHMWPMSHCKTFVDKLCAVEDLIAEPPTAEQKVWNKSKIAMRCVVDAAQQKRNSDGGTLWEALWFARLARTISHEIGHCFALGHCVYYACNMQGTAGMKEDVRQPPYLCPVDEAKLAHAVAEELKGGKTDKDKVAWKGERCMKLIEFCEGLQERGLESAMWSGYMTWLEERLGRAVGVEKDGFRKIGGAGE